MNGKEYSKLDHFLIRAKDIVFLLGLVGALFIFVGKWNGIPQRLEANEAEIERVKGWETQTDTRLTVIEQDVKYLVKGVDEIKRSLQRGR